MKQAKLSLQRRSFCMLKCVSCDLWGDLLTCTQEASDRILSYLMIDPLAFYLCREEPVMCGVWAFLT